MFSYTLPWKYRWYQFWRFYFFQSWSHSRWTREIDNPCREMRRNIPSVWHDITLSWLLVHPSPPLLHRSLPDPLLTPFIRISPLYFNLDVYITDTLINDSWFYTACRFFPYSFLSNFVESRGLHFKLKENRSRVQHYIWSLRVCLNISPFLYSQDLTLFLLLYGTSVPVRIEEYRASSNEKKKTYVDCSDR